MLIVLVIFPATSFATDPSAIDPFANPPSSTTSIPVESASNSGGLTFLNNPASACTGSGLGNVICIIQQLLNSIVPLLLALGVVYFVWGVVQYMVNDSEEAKSKGKDKIIYGIIGFAVIVGLWGLVNVVVNTFDLGSSTAPTLTKLTGSASTCDLSNNPKVQDFLCYITRIINDSVIPLIFALAVVMFVWGTIKFFIINSDEEAKRAQGKQFMIWGIVALAVMLSIWGLVAILGSTFNVKSNVLPQVHPPGATSP